jgi:H+-translocating NAD(P) transhydrogenase subunit beta
MMASLLSSLRTFAVPVLYIASAVFFIAGLKAVCKVRAAGKGTTLLAIGFVLALAGIAVETAGSDLKLALAGVAVGAILGLIIGLRAQISLGRGIGPLLAGAGGVVSVLVAVAAFLSEEDWPLAGALALTGGLRGAALGLAVLAGLGALVLAVLAAVGPAARASGQPAAVALSASASGLAAAMVGFALGNPIVVTVGALAATAGWTLSAIVAQSLGRKPSEIVLRPSSKTGKTGEDYGDVQTCGAEEAAMVLENAHTVVMVPGYGMAVAQAQHALYEVGKILEQRGAKVFYAIHPAAGLIPGHMNILLDEAKVPAVQLLEWEAANAKLAEADVALVVGANDIVNPATQIDPHSAVYGMPLIDAGLARTVFVIKRSLRPGTAGVKNALFEGAHTTLVFGDAKKVLQAIGVELKAQLPKAKAA